MKKVFLLIYLVTQITYSQVLVEMDFKSLKPDLIANNNLDNVFLTKENAYFSLLRGERYIKETNSMDRNYTVKGLNGQEYSLKKNEYPVEIINKTLYTFTENIGTSEREYSTYNISNNVLTKISSINLSISSTISVIKNGDIILKEGGHSGSDWVALYDKDFNFIHKFKPFNDVSHINSDANENYIVYVAQVNTDNKIRMALYGSFADKGLVKTKEIDIDSNLNLSSIHMANEKIIILFSNTTNSSSTILILDKKLELVKKVTLKERASYNKIISDTTNFYINTKSNLTTFNIEKGEKVNSIKKEQSQIVKTKEGYKFRGSNIFLLDNNYLLMLEADFEDGKKEINDVVLSIISTTDMKVVQVINIKDSFNNDIYIKTFGDKILVSSINNILFYEKK